MSEDQKPQNSLTSRGGVFLALLVVNVLASVSVLVLMTLRGLGLL